ncbi:MAG: hypothetical protein V2I43_15540 [Parvularcula sp.]|jgi:hypothetical protein|nr:hypothetical protein [Parvularcula sp.]
MDIDAEPFIGWTRTGTAHIDHFQVMGERRSGTNFAEQLFETNLRARRVESYGWKHGMPTMAYIKPSALIIVVIREAFDWLGSLHNRPFAKSHGGLAMSDFLRKEWYEIYRPGHFGVKTIFGTIPKVAETANQVDRHPITGKRFRDVFELRAVKAEASLGYLNRECNAVILRYHDLSRNPVGMVRAVTKTFGLALRQADVATVGLVGPKGFSKTRLRRDDMSADDITYVQSRLNRNLETSMGFEDTFR